jgi:MFS family permease
MVPVALAFAVLGLGGSASALGLVLTAQIGPAALFMLVGGVVGDRMPRRSLMVTADAVRAASQGAMAIALLTGTATIALLAGLAAVSGTATAFFEPAAQGVLPSLAGEELLGRANAARATNMATGLVVWPLLAGLLVTLAEPGWALAGDALSFAVSGTLLAGLPRVAAAAGGGVPLVQDLRAGWREFSSRTWVWTSLVAAGTARLMFAAFYVLGPIVAVRRLGGAPAWSVIGAGFGAGLFIGGATAFRLRPGRPLLASSLAASLLALPLAFLALAAPVAAIATAALVAGAGVMLGVRDIRRLRPAPELALA